MNGTHHDSVFATADRPITRRRLFELGGVTVGIAAVIAACSSDDAAEPGRVGNAPGPTDRPQAPVDDVS